MQQEIDKFELALTLINTTKANVFLTGKAGTGKTTFLNRLKKECLKGPFAVVAPTGIAAINAQGVTMHSMFQLPLHPFLPGVHGSIGANLNYEKIEILQKLELLIIDEVSMLRADMLDAIDYRLRKSRNSNDPFGGVQLLMIGDLLQLPPVAKAEEAEDLKQYYDSLFFFESQALKKSGFVSIELTKIFRQDDKEFKDILNAVRDGYVPNHMLDKLNERYIPNFKPSKDEDYIRLVTHNRQVEEINMEGMEQIAGPSCEYHALIEDDFPASYYPVAQTIVLKIGAHVMFCKNKPGEYVNGSLGVVTSLSEYSVKVRLVGHSDEIEVKPSVWENVEYKLVKPKKEGSETEVDENAAPRLEAEVVGRFTQLPLRLAWAITIHKSQGLTFDRAIIDAHLAFAPGQTYVALSRCRSLEGIVLSEKVTWKSIKSDKTVRDFYKTQLKKLPTQKELVEMQRGTYIEYVSNFLALSRLKRLFGLLVDYLDIIKLSYKACYNKVCFANNTYLYGDTNGEINYRIVELKDKIQNTPDYSNDKQIQEMIVETCKMNLDNLSNIAYRISPLSLEDEIPDQWYHKIGKENSEFLLERTKNAVDFYRKLLNYVIQNGFSLEKFLRVYHNLDYPKTPLDEMKVSITAPKAKPKIPEGIQYQNLYDALMKWRREKAKEAGVQTWQILYNCCLEEVTTRWPLSMDDLATVDCISEDKLMKYGEELLTIVKEQPSVTNNK